MATTTQAYDSYPVFCENVRRILVRKGWSQADLANAMGNTRSWVTQALNGYCRPGIGVIDKFAAALDVAPHKLLEPPRK